MRGRPDFAFGLLVNEMAFCLEWLVLGYIDASAVGQGIVKSKENKLTGTKKGTAGFCRVDENR